MAEQILKQILEKTQQFEKFVDEKLIKGKNIIFLFGVTGSGKTTIANMLEGEKLTVEQLGDTLKYFLVGPGISNKCESATQDPVFHQSSNAFICDCPGFHDTGGVEREILHNYQYFKLLQKSKQNNNKIKILLVAAHENLICARGSYVAQVKRRLNQMFPSIQSFDDSFGLVITKCLSKELNNNGYNAPILSEFKPENIFCFPQPKSADQIYDTEQTDLGKLNNFISNNTTYLQDPEIKISLDSDSMSLINKALNKQIENQEKLFDDIYDILTNEYAQNLRNYSNIQSKIDFLNRQLQTIEKLNRNQINNFDSAKQFVSDFHSMTPFNNIKEKLNSLGNTFIFSEYIQKVLTQTEIPEKLNAKKNMIFIKINQWLKSEIDKEEAARRAAEERRRKEEAARRAAEERRRIEEAERRAAEERRRIEEAERRRRIAEREATEARRKLDKQRREYRVPKEETYIEREERVVGHYYKYFLWAEWDHHDRIKVTKRTYKRTWTELYRRRKRPIKFFGITIDSKYLGIIPGSEDIELIKKEITFYNRYT